MIASLPMYDRAETAAANDRLWSEVRAAMGSGPNRLHRSDDANAAWRSPDLFLSQTCGLPYRAGLWRSLHLVASPDHGLPDCPAGFCRSALVARADDPRNGLEAFDGATLAFNGADSQSGWAAPIAEATARGLTLVPGPETGAHRLSALAVAQGRADLASLDIVSWTMIARWDGFARSLKVIGLTEPTPALPFVTANAELAAPLMVALATAISRLSAEDRDTLCLHGVVAASDAAYRALPLPPLPSAVARG